MSDKTSAIGGIIAIMQSSWDLPADCNEGELFTYAEILFDRIRAGEAGISFTLIFPAFRSTVWTCQSRTPSEGSSTAQSISSAVRAELIDAIVDRVSRGP
jgi:hypothetical protein